MSDESWAPLALFIYNRPEHTRRMIKSLQGCEGFAESSVHVFADGPRRTQDIPAVQEARAEAKRLLGNDAVYFERDANVGVEDSIIAGVTQLCDQYGSAVVIEDDLLFSPHFLKFLNVGLRRYRDEPRVMQVCGYMYDVPQFRQRSEGMFLPMTNSLGWGTWKRAWDQFSPEATGWRERFGDARERKRFDLEGHYSYTKMLSHHMTRGLPAWDIRWYYSVFSNNGLVLYPPRTLVLHTGFDGTGTHDRFSLPVHQAELETNATFDLPAQVAVEQDKALVFKAAKKFRPASNVQKAIAVARFFVRRVGRARVAGPWSRKKGTAEAETGKRGGGAPTRGS